jgi:hypothetical protein
MLNLGSLVLIPLGVSAQVKQSTEVREMSLEPPYLTITDAATDGSWTITGFSQVRRARDGGFLVPSDAEIHRFNSRGQHTAMIGRKGRGPGEFTNIQGVAECADGRLIVADWIQERLSVLPSKPAKADVIAYPKSVSSSDLPISCDSGIVTFRENLLNTRMPTPWPRGTLRQDTILVLRSTPKLERFDTLARMAGGSTFDGLVQPFGGIGVVKTNDKSIVAARTDDSVFQVQPLSKGQTRKLVVRGLAVIPVTGEMRADKTAQSKAKTPPSIWEKELGDAYANVPWPSHLPLWGNLILDDNSRLWISDYHSPLEKQPTPTRWRVINQSGGLLGMLTLGQGDNLVAVRGNEAVIIHRAEDDTESLQVRRIKGM